MSTDDCVFVYDKDEQHDGCNGCAFDSPTICKLEGNDDCLTKQGIWRLKDADNS